MTFQSSNVYYVKPSPRGMPFLAPKDHGTMGGFVSIGVMGRSFAIGCCEIVSLVIPKNFNIDYWMNFSYKSKCSLKFSSLSSIILIVKKKIHFYKSPVLF